jgi:hypothetical protein
LHFRFHDLKFCNLITKIIKKLANESNFAGCIQLGDAIDLWQISEFDKDPRRRETVLDDLLLYSAFLDKCEAIMPKGTIWHNLEGNHERRCTRWSSKKNPEMYNMMKTVPEVLGFPERNRRGRVKFKWHPYMRWDSCKISNTVFHHGFFFPQHVAMKNLQTYPCNFVGGHTHRLQFVTDGTKFSVSLGHGSDADATMHTPTPISWHQALGVFYASTKVDRIDIIPVNQGECLLWGQSLKSG